MALTLKIIFLNMEKRTRHIPLHLMVTSRREKERQIASHENNPQDYLLVQLEMTS